jgi:S-formylglutathione hydrolase FrmB
MGPELVSKVEEWFPVAQSVDKRFIAGLSMGGYGALRLALSSAGTYGHAASLSGALMIGSQPVINPLRSMEYQEEITRIFGSNPVGTDHDLLSLAERCDKSNQLPKLWMDCGRSDFLFDDNQTFHARLNALKVPVTYTISDGSHDWQYWNRLLPDVLRWMGFTPAD